MKSASYTFTVFTPTYNRAHTLHRVFESLVAQTYRDFEWLVIDDGSTDGTGARVEEWSRTSDFAIRYVWQPNQGKHIAHNVAVREAKGALFLTLDSDDACVPEALERLHWHWESIPETQRSEFSAVTVLVKDQHGNVVGDSFPYGVFDGNLAEMVYRHNVRGEKWGFQRTDILRQNPFIAETGRGVIPEGILWQQIGLQYRMRFVNEVLRIYNLEGASLSRGRRPGEDAYGRRLYYLDCLNNHIGYLTVAPAKLYVEAVKFAYASFHLDMPVRSQMRELRPLRARVLWALSLPVAWLLWTRDKSGIRQSRGVDETPLVGAPTATPAFRFTVLTPTYNRAHTLPAVYESLCSQTFRDFEWLIIDDGSTDATPDLVRRWIAEGRIAIRYYWQPNGGKHVAFNHGIREARGELLLTLDSDDQVLPDAMARLDSHWSSIPNRERFSGITGLCLDPQGRVIGTSFPQDVLDASPLDLMAENKYEGDKWGFQRVDLLRGCPYPEIPGEHFIPEGVVWNRLAEHYLIRFVNEPLRVVEYRTDGLSAGLLRLRAESPRGAMLYYHELAGMARSRSNRSKALVNLARFACHARTSVWSTLRAARAGVALPLYVLAGWALWWQDTRAITKLHASMPNE